jgi:hypothetical protein
VVKKICVVSEQLVETKHECEIINHGKVEIFVSGEKLKKKTE